MLPCLRLPMRLQVGRLSVAGSLGPAQTSPPYQTIKVTQECLLLDSTGSRLAYYRSQSSMLSRPSLRSPNLLLRQLSSLLSLNTESTKN